MSVGSKRWITLHFDIHVSLMLTIRSLFYTIVIPGTVTVLVPYLIASGSGERSLQQGGLLQVLGMVAVALGATILLRCIWDLMVTGRGTLAPVDPPTQLVMRGLYRYVRNPMYLGVFILLLGEAAFFESFCCFCMRSPGS